MDKVFIGVPRINFKTEESIIAYMFWLRKKGLDYHWDDNPVDVYWGSVDDNLSTKDINMLQQNHDHIWAMVNPWTLIENNQQLWDTLIGTNEED